MAWYAYGGIHLHFVLLIALDGKLFTNGALISTRVESYGMREDVL